MRKTALLLGLAAASLSACTSVSTDNERPDQREGLDSASTAEPNASPAPPGFEAALIGTRSRGTVLRVRTVGSGSCPFTAEEVVAMGDFIEVRDEPDAADDEQPCTADSRPSVWTYSVPAGQADDFRAASAVVVRLSTGKRFITPLLPGME
jgi:hypothetical protein